MSDVVHDNLIYVFVIMISLVLFYSTVSNILVIVSVVRFRKLRTVTHVLISHLAVADILLAVLYMPPKLQDATHPEDYQEVEFNIRVLISHLAVVDILLAVLYMPPKLQDATHPEDYQEGDVVCKLINSVPILLVTSSCYTMVCISFERRRAIIACHKPQMTLAQLYKVIPAIWLSSALVSLPTNFVYAVGHLDTHVTNDNASTSGLLHCQQNMPDSFVSVNKYFVLTVSFLIPLVLVFNNYIRLLGFINRRGRQVFQTSGQVTTVSGRVAASSVSGIRNGRLANTLRRRRIKLMKMLVIVAVMFAVSWLPYFVIYIYMKATRKDASKHAGSGISLLLITMATFSTAYNSVIYVVFNTGFREAFRSILRGACIRTDLHVAH